MTMSLAATWHASKAIEAIGPRCCFARAVVMPVVIGEWRMVKKFIRRDRMVPMGGELAFDVRHRPHFHHSKLGRTQHLHVYIRSGKSLVSNHCLLPMHRNQHF
jgi:hypothetical protein